MGKGVEFLFTEFIEHKLKYKKKLLFCYQMAVL